ncbi:uncharacterized protein [Phyllobates terribilis]|uniref:uncharacterized protein n=1 Tax=Phyllobates terribilis TaxID=111132 RepID=UPI003CCAF34D
MYPQWVNAERDAQEEIMYDIKNRWRSVTDRLVKYHQSVQSGSSPKKRKFPFADELAFILTSRSLRRTEGNIMAPTAEEDTNTEQAEEESEDFFQLSSPDPSASASSASGCPSHSLSNPADIGTGLVTDSPAPAPSDAGSSAGDVLRPTGRGSGSAHLVASRRAGKKKAKTHGGGTIVLEALTNRTLSLVERASQEDAIDKFCSAQAARIRSLPRDRQNMYMTAAGAMVMAIEEAAVMPSPPAVVCGIFNCFKPSVPPPRPAAATQRFGQVAAAYRPEDMQPSYGRQMAHGASSFIRGPSPNSTFSQEMFPGYSFEEDLQNL